MTTLLTIKEVKERLQCSLANAYALIESGELAHYRIGAGRGGIRVSEEQLQQFLARREQKGESILPTPLKHIKARQLS